MRVSNKTKRSYEYLITNNVMLDYIYSLTLTLYHSEVSSYGVAKRS